MRFTIFIERILSRYIYLFIPRLADVHVISKIAILVETGPQQKEVRAASYFLFPMRTLLHYFSTKSTTIVPRGISSWPRPFSKLAMAIVSIYSF